MASAGGGQPEEVPEGSEVIIRSHGESRAVHEGLHARGVRILDATCPNVTRIHQIVARAEEQGRQPIIIGTRDHPEVLAIAGWCCRPVVLSGAEELENWLAEDPTRRQMPLTFVSQTTAIRRVWDSCVKKRKKMSVQTQNFLIQYVEATSKRQEEAVQLAAQCGAMVVIGDRQSSNTRKLAELCREVCPSVQLIERVDDLELSPLRGTETVGITAGASTPAWIIRRSVTK